MGGNSYAKVKLGQDHFKKGEGRRAKVDQGDHRAPIPGNPTAAIGTTSTSKLPIGSS